MAMIPKEHEHVIMDHLAEHTTLAEALAYEVNHKAGNMNQTAAHVPTPEEKWRSASTRKAAHCRRCGFGVDKRRGGVIKPGEPEWIYGDVCPGCLQSFCHECSFPSLIEYGEENECGARVCPDCFILQVKGLLNGEELSMEVLQMLSSLQKAREAIKDVKDLQAVNDMIMEVLKQTQMADLIKKMSIPIQQDGKGGLKKLPLFPGGRGPTPEEADLLNKAAELGQHMARERDKTLLEIFRKEEEKKKRLEAQAIGETPPEPPDAPQDPDGLLPYQLADKKLLEALKDAGDPMMDIMERVRREVSKGKTVHITQEGKTVQVIKPDGYGGLDIERP